MCSVVRKMAQYMSDILEPEDRAKLHENLLVGASKLPMEVSCLFRTLDQVVFLQLHPFSLVHSCV